MKRIVKMLFILMVAIVVFTGVLLIFEGARTPLQTSAAPADAPVRSIPLDDNEGSAV